MSGNRFGKALTKPAVDPDKLAEFVGGARRETMAPAVAPAVAPAPTTESDQVEEPAFGYVSLPEQDQGGKLTDGVLFRCTPSVMAEMDFVFRNCTAKSKQKMLESIILPQINELAKKIRGSGSNGE